VIDHGSASLKAGLASGTSPSIEERSILARAQFTLFGEPTSHRFAECSIIRCRTWSEPQEKLASDFAFFSVCFTAARPSSSDLHGCSRHRTESVSRPPACAGQPSAAALYHRMTVRVLETWKHQLVAYILSYDKRA
jgi:hypothetical protein